MTDNKIPYLLALSPILLLIILLSVNVVIYANQLLRSAFPAMQDTAKSILQHSRSLECDDRMLSIKEILNLIPGTK